MSNFDIKAAVAAGLTAYATGNYTPIINIVKQECRKKAQQFGQACDPIIDMIINTLGAGQTQEARDTIRQNIKKGVCEDSPNDPTCINIVVSAQPTPSPTPQPTPAPPAPGPPAPGPPAPGPHAPYIPPQAPPPLAPTPAPSKEGFFAENAYLLMAAGFGAICLFLMCCAVVAFLMHQKSEDEKKKSQKSTMSSRSQHRRRRKGSRSKMKSVRKDLEKGEEDSDGDLGKTKKKKRKKRGDD